MPKPQRLGDPAKRNTTPEYSTALAWAAVTFLNREIDRLGEVRLTPADFDAVDLKQGIQTDMDGDTLILRHVKPNAGPVS
jgi:hypothetical protein